MNEGQKRWERQPEEPAKWFDHFDRFRLLGASRTIEEAWRLDPNHRGKRPSRQWYENAERWEWVDRAEAWDDEQRAAAEEQWGERRRAFSEKVFSVREKLLDRLEQMLAQPLVEMTREFTADGLSVTQIIKPARWSYRDMKGMADALELLERYTEELGRDGDEEAGGDHYVTFTRGEDVTPPPERAGRNDEEEYEEGEE